MTPSQRIDEVVLLLQQARNKLVEISADKLFEGSWGQVSVADATDHVGGALNALGYGDDGEGD